MDEKSPDSFIMPEYDIPTSVTNDITIDRYILKKTMVRVIACVSDLHLGSKYSVINPSSKDENGAPYGKNEGQLKLFSYWKDFCEKCDEVHVDTVFVLGDTCHGPDRKGGGENLITPNLNAQVNMAEDLLEMLIQPGRKCYFVPGSPYHSAIYAGQLEKFLCERFGGIWGVVQNLTPKEFPNKTFCLSHGGGGAMFYRETAQAREMIYGRVAYADKKLPNISMYVHGHFHWFNYMHQVNGHSLQLPCWTSLEPLPMFIKNYTKAQPDIGGAIIFMDEAGRITVWHMGYPLPHIADEVQVI